EHGFRDVHPTNFVVVADITQDIGQLERVAAIDRERSRLVPDGLIAEAPDASADDADGGSDAVAVILKSIDCFETRPDRARIVDVHRFISMDIEFERVEGLQKFRVLQFVSTDRVDEREPDLVARTGTTLELTGEHRAGRLAELGKPLNRK